MQNARIWLWRGLFLLVLASCALFEPQSKIAAGQVFQSGQPQYDDLFTKVHALQVEATGWSDDKKTARRSLIDALKIATDAVDVTILQATHERMVSIAHVVGTTRLDLRDDDGHLVMQAEGRADLSTKDFLKALQATVDGEIKRKRALRDVPQRCDDLTKAAHELEPRVKTDFFRQGGTMMADVHDEIAASLEVLAQISKTSRLERRETEDFIADLGRAVAADPTEPLTRSADAGATTTSRPIATTRPKPPVTTTTQVVTPPKPKPPPPKPQGDEVFNP